jgi:Ca2+-binding RTX toxin-like protein
VSRWGGRWNDARALAAAALLCGLVGALAQAGPAGAQSSLTACSLSESGPPGPAGDQLEVSFSEFDTIEVERTGQRIRIKAGDSEDSGGGTRLVACAGAAATVTNVDEIALTVFPDPSFPSHPGDELSADVVLDLQEGGLAPGATDEGDGGSEIELSLVGTAGHPQHPQVSIIGSPLADAVAFGANPAGANLNAAEPVPDTDFPGAASEDSAVYGGNGDDVLRVAGIANGLLGEGGNDLIVVGVGGFATGGGGNDTLVGGTKGDFLMGGPGNDLIESGGGGDLVIAGSGLDSVGTGPARDLVFTADGRRDRVRCGGGRDGAGIDRKDRRKGCEQVAFLKGTPDLFD